MKHKINDTVTIREDSVECNFAHPEDYLYAMHDGIATDVVNHEMFSLQGSKAIITGTFENKYLLNIDNGKNTWVDEMFV